MYPLGNYLVSPYQFNLHDPFTKGEGATGQSNGGFCRSLPQGSISSIDFIISSRLRGLSLCSAATESRSSVLRMDRSVPLARTSAASNSSQNEGPVTCLGIRKDPKENVFRE